MKKRVFILALFLLVLVNTALSAHTTSLIEFQNDDTYETNSNNFQFGLFFNTSQLYNITLNHPDFSTPTVYLSTPCEINVENVDNIKWCNINSNAFNLNIDLIANQVTSNKSINWSVVVEDAYGFSTVNLVTVNILDDSIPPKILNLIPQNNSIVKNITINFWVNVSEEQTAVKSGKVYYDFYTLFGGGSTFTNSQDLVCTQNYCSVDLDIGLLNVDPNTFKYATLAFEINDSVDNSAITELYIGVDGELPVVNLESPPGTVTNEVALSLQYNATDNSYTFNPLLNPSLDCTLMVDSSPNNNQTITDGTTKTFAVNTTGLLDGPHTWQVVCVDKAGWVEGSITSNFILDTTGPNITLISPINNSLNNGLITTINLSVIDLYSSVDSVWYSLNGGSSISLASPYDIPTATWIEGLNSLVVYANDSLNNLAQNTFVFTIDNTPPVISGLSPVNDTLTNLDITFNYTATDNYASTITCDLYINPLTPLTGIVSNNGDLVSTLVSLAEGNYNWYVNCTDEVGLSSIAPSPLNTLTIDTTPPTINLISPVSGSNDVTLGAISFQYLVSDNYGFNLLSCLLNINGITIPELGGGIIYNPPSSNYPYSWYITCDDNAGNSADSVNYTLYRDDVDPVIYTNTITESKSCTTATIKWETNELAQGIINYSTDQTNLNLTTLESFNVTLHTLEIPSLAEGTQYFYQISSIDNFGNSVKDPNTYNFTTKTGCGSTSSSSSSRGSGGGSGGGLPVCKDEHFLCNSWGDCQGMGTIGSQLRTCEMVIDCAGDYRPISLRDCVMPEQEPDEDEEPISGMTGITGFSIIDGLRSTLAIAIIALLIVGLTGALFYRWLWLGK